MHNAVFNGCGRIICLMVRRSVVAIVCSLLLSGTLAPGMAAQKNLQQRGTLSKNCSGLHAGIRAQIIPPYTETPSVMLTFVLLNDSEMPVDVGAGSWGIVIDERELKNSGMLFGNGVTPVGGYRILQPGETHKFGISLPITEYFLPNGQHKVSWRGAVFQSPTITVTITPASH